MTDELTENYKRAFGRRVGFGTRPALILIDLCRGYYDPACDLYMGSNSSLDSALRVREAASAAGIPVILTKVVYHASTIDGGRFFEKSKPLHYFIEGGEFGAWAEGLDPRPEELVVAKQYPSAFFGTSLASTLTAHGVDSVLLSGVSTSGCVRATCVDAMSHGFRTAVIAEACGDRHPDPHNANLFDMDAKYADVVSEEETIAFLRTLGNTK